MLMNYPCQTLGVFLCVWRFNNHRITSSDWAERVNPLFPFTRYSGAAFVRTRLVSLRRLLLVLHFLLWHRRAVHRFLRHVTHICTASVCWSIDTTWRERDEQVYELRTLTSTEIRHNFSPLCFPVVLLTYSDWIKVYILFHATICINMSSNCRRSVPQVHHKFVKKKKKNPYLMQDYSLSWATLHTGL